ncbi:type II secretion system protein [Nocardioides sp. GY 10113]|uniref:type II secretion system F family protein n=1 Tax=Nocardioides sp. GY 10113 TaxID=2569761 RepID=UPI0010A75A0E|nr:type II secretion system F family protein [Nocardioides sp. GY 10113]TIC85088.1 type II secretion system protein [Nocardioides sp. GY 10113]
MSGVLAVLAAIAAAALLAPAPPRVRGAVRRAGPAAVSAPQRSAVPRGSVALRAASGLVAAAGAAAFLGGPLALPGGAAVGIGTWVAAGRIEPRQVRRLREEARRDLPHLVGLLAAALRAGSAPPDAVNLVVLALPGAAADRLAPVAARLALGADPGPLWSGLAADPALAPLGRTMARTHRTGAPVAEAVQRLAADLAAGARAETEDRARSVGVRAAVPLGICLLPAFLLLGIVPVVAGLAGTLAW